MGENISSLKWKGKNESALGGGVAHVEETEALPYRYCEQSLSPWVWSAEYDDHTKVTFPFRQQCSHPLNVTYPLKK